MLLDKLERAGLPRTDADLPLYGLLRYHLGFVDATFRPEQANAGKRVRPRLCLYACEAAGGDPELALPAAAAIELIHNFTLIHDDIQDRSVMRRHRPTIWSIWGQAQAINAGDAMFAVAHLALNAAREAGLDPATVLDLSTRLHETTLRIVEGQVLDLGFEVRDDVAVDEYLTMIRGKTAAITRFACQAGARIGGASPETVQSLGDFGEALGIGFQMRDDLLGVWGDPEETGKSAADDIRQRKKALPALLLIERATGQDRRRARALYNLPALGASDVEEILALMNRYEIEPLVQTEVQRWHDRAESLLHQAVPDAAARFRLDALVESLVVRSG